MRNGVGLAVAAVGWISLVVCAFQPLLAYQSKSGVATAVQGQWPAETQLQRATRDKTIVLFLHPMCPCSRATLSGLDRLGAAAGKKLNAVLLFEQPKSFKKEWAQFGLWKQAQDIPGAECVVDYDQIEAKRFNAKTSGDMFIYDADGTLRFHGGITPGRGHEGDCDGYENALKVLRDSPTQKLSESLTFGCGLFNK